MIQPVKKGKDISIMVWAAFSGALGRSDLIVMERDPDAPKGGYSAQSYLKVLEDQLPRIWEPGYIYRTMLQFIKRELLLHSCEKMG